MTRMPTVDDQTHTHKNTDMKSMDAFPLHPLTKCVKSSTLKETLNLLEIQNYCNKSVSWPLRSEAKSLIFVECGVDIKSYLSWSMDYSSLPRLQSNL